jgi:peptidoglycan/LPS O-acetylase OafA/YrhL
MFHPVRVHLAWQRTNPLDEASGQSLLISLLRGLAALQVAAAHLRAELFPSLRGLGHAPITYQLLAFLTGFAHQAVVFFFLVSGWLVGGSLLNKLEARPETGTLLRDYAIDRSTRLWTVLAPAMLIMLVIGAVVGDIDPLQPDLAASTPASGAAPDYSAAAFTGNLFGLQTILVENFGGNYALWSLANETWYYAAFPLLLLAFMPGSGARRAGAIAALVLLGAALPYRITLYFALWLLGVLFSRVRIDCAHGVRLALVALAALLAVYYRITGRNDDLVPASFLQDLVLSLPLLALLSSLHAPLTLASAPKRQAARVATWLSNFSFTLYVTHVPFIKLLRYASSAALGRSRLDPNAPLDYALYAAVLGILVLLAWICYHLFEAHTFRIRRAVKSAWRGRPQPGELEPVRVE